MNSRGLVLPKSNIMTKNEVNKFEKVQAQMAGIYNEVGILSKKSPNDAVSKFKLKFINQLLAEANELLKNEYKPFEGFEIFDVDDLPTNSDVTMMFEQYINCLEKLRNDNIVFSTSSYEWYWAVDGKMSNIRTTKPSRIIEKK